MIKALLISCFCLLGSLPGISQDFYDMGTVNTIEIQFREANWEQILKNLYAGGNNERLIGTVTINGEKFDSVGVRYKGNSSYSRNRIKNPFNIKLDHIIKDQKLNGFGTLKLSNGFKDPSMVRETLGYDIARKYMPAPLANYARVFVNDAYIGLYTNVQDVDMFFMQSHLHTRDQVRLKGELSGGALGKYGVWEYLGADSTIYHQLYQLESAHGWQDLITFLDTLNRHQQHIDKLLNVDRHLWFLALHNLLVNLDSPINVAQNYYLFGDAAGHLNPIPWDMNECFGAFTHLISQGQLNIRQMQQLSPFANSGNARYPVISGILNNQTYRKMYVAHMKTILEENFMDNWYLERASQIQDIIDHYVQSDNNKLYPYSQFRTNIQSAAGNQGPPPNFMIAGIAELMDARKHYLMSLPAFSARAPELSGHEQKSAWNQDGKAYNVRSSHATNVYLAYRYDKLTDFEVLEMFDDGQHDDEAAGDGIFGISLPSGPSSIEYYFYAVNHDAAVFLPKRAAYETFSTSLADGLVINEFMADNQSSVADQDGGYDDWIELYNKTNQTLQLKGFHLSDNPDRLDKWVFPDTLIAPDGYLIIWADNDTGQAGLHARFALSKEGESIVLSDNQLKIIDQVTFAGQQTDVSMGRFPNGTGEFVFMTPTFGTENADQATDLHITIDDTPVQFHAFPNPFNHSLSLVYGISKPSRVILELFNNYGQRTTLLELQHPDAGRHEITVSTEGLRPGLWICRFIADDQIITRKIIKLP